ncbi:reverse transcriptase domain-containing protein [Tanacetum coccineum]
MLDGVAKVNMVAEEEGRTWITPIREYMEKGTLSDDPDEERTIREKINNYVIEDGVLYQKSYLGPFLQCIGPLQARYVVREIHMGSCGMHDGPKRVVHKAMNTGYYWPSMHRDANQEIKSYDTCQAYAVVPRLPKDDMISVRSTATIIADNETQLINEPFKSWAEGLEIKGISTLGRGTTERALGPHDNAKNNNGETPFSFAYGTEAVIPAEIGMPTRRTTQRNIEENYMELRLNLNLLEERREITIIKEARRNSRWESTTIRGVHHKQFRTREFVLRKNEVSKAESTCKLRPKWEGPYEIIEAYETGAYKLRNMDGKEVPRTWLSSNLLKYYM